MGNPLAGIILYGPIKQILTTFATQLTLIETSSQMQVWALKAPSRYGKSTLKWEFVISASSKRWIPIIYQLPADDRSPQDILMGFIEECLAELSTRHPSHFEAIRNRFRFVKNVTENSQLSDAEFSNPVSEVLMTWRQDRIPSNNELRRDLSLLTEQALVSRSAGILFIIENSQNLVSKKYGRQLTAILAATLQALDNHKCFFIFTGTDVPSEIEYTNSFQLLAMNEKDITNFLNEVFTNRIISSMTVSDIIRVTGGVPGDVKKLVTALYEEFGNDERQVKINWEVFSRLTAPDDDKIYVFNELEDSDVETLIRLIDYEGWTIDEIARYEAFADFILGAGNLPPNIKLKTINIKLKDAAQHFTELGIIDEDYETKGLALLGTAYSRLLLNILGSDRKIPLGDVKGPFALSMLDLIKKHVLSKFTFREIFTIKESDLRGEAPLDILIEWSKNFPYGATLQKTKTLIEVVQNGYQRQFSYRPQSVAFLSHMIDANSIHEYYLSLLSIGVTTRGQTTTYFTVVMAPPDIKEKDVSKKIKEEIVQLESTLNLLGVSLVYTDTLPAQFPPLEEIATYALESDNYRLVEEIIDTFLSRGMQIFGQGKLNEAQKIFQRAVSLQTSKRSNLHKALSHNAVAFTLAAQKQYNEALNNWNLAVEFYPKEQDKRMAFTWQDIGYVRAKLGDFDGAILACEGALTYDNHRDLQISFLYILFCHPEGTKDAVDVWNWELAYSPKVRTVTLCTLAAIYMLRDSNRVEALKLLNQALLLSPEALYVYRAFGWYYVMIGDKEKALSSFSQAKENAKADMSDYPCYNEELNKVSELLEEREDNHVEQLEVFDIGFVVPIRSDLPNKSIVLLDHTEVKLKNNHEAHSLLAWSEIYANSAPIFTIIVGATKLSLLWADQLDNDDGLNWIPYVDCGTALSEEQLDLLETLLLEWAKNPGDKS